MEYTHAGTKITFDERTAKFSAMVAGKLKTSTALQALKNQIDKAAKEAFEPFQIIFAEAEDRYGEGGMVIKTARVIGVEKSRSRYGHDEWLTDGTTWGRTRREVIRDTAENRVALQAWIDHKNESDQLYGARKAVEEALDEKVPAEKPPKR